MVETSILRARRRKRRMVNWHFTCSQMHATSKRSSRAINYEAKPAGRSIAPVSLRQTGRQRQRHRQTDRQRKREENLSSYNMLFVVSVHSRTRSRLCSRSAHPPSPRPPSKKKKKPDKLSSTRWSLFRAFRTSRPRFAALESAVAIDPATLRFHFDDTISGFSCYVCVCVRACV